MINKEKHPKLYEATEEIVKRRLDWLTEAIEARLLCELLPDEIKKLDIVAVDSSGDRLNLRISGAEGTVLTLQRLGIQGLKPKVSSFSDKEFYARGEGKLPNGVTLSVWVGGLAQTEGCHVVKKRKLRTEYALVCEGTGKEI